MEMNGLVCFLFIFIYLLNFPPNLPQGNCSVTILHVHRVLAFFLQKTTTTPTWKPYINACMLILVYYLTRSTFKMNFALNVQISNPKVGITKKEIALSEKENYTAKLREV